jgi:tRNA A37 methylthiotransferase MiaB
MEGHLPENIKDDRLARLFAAHDVLAKAEAKKYEGQTLQVLVEKKEKTGKWFGRSSQNKNVYFSIATLPSTPSDQGADKETGKIEEYLPTAREADSLTSNLMDNLIGKMVAVKIETAYPSVLHGKLWTKPIKL